MRPSVLVALVKRPRNGSQTGRLVGVAFNHGRNGAQVRMASGSVLASAADTAAHSAADDVVSEEIEPVDFLRRLPVSLCTYDHFLALFSSATLCDDDER